MEDFRRTRQWRVIDVFIILKLEGFSLFLSHGFFLLHEGMIGYFSIIPDLCSRNIARGCSATSLFNST